MRISDWSSDVCSSDLGEYRQRFADGETRTRISGAYDDARAEGDFSFRGHVDSETRFAIDPIWRWGADVPLASDATYLQRYGFRWDERSAERRFGKECARTSTPRWAPAT